MSDVEILERIQDSLASLQDALYRLEVLLGKELSIRESFLPKICPIFVNDGRLCGLAGYSNKPCTCEKAYMECQDFSLWFWKLRAESLRSNR